jgi:hypothetical protein
MKYEHEPFFFSLQMFIGDDNELVNVICTQEDFRDPPEIHKVIFKGTDILGCLSPEMIEDLIYDADVALKEKDQAEKTEDQISQWESDEADRNHR